MFAATEKFGVLFLLLVLAADFSGPRPAVAAGRQEKSVSANVEVPPRAWKGIRLTRVAAGTEVEIHVQSDGRIRMLLLDEAAFERLPLEGVALLEGSTTDMLRLSTRIPASGEWYLVLDNRGGARARAVRVAITARAPEQPPRAASAAPGGDDEADGEGATDLASALDRVERALLGAFVLDGLEIQVVGCGRGNAYAAPARILICREFVQGLVDDLGGDSRRLSDVLLFALMHEASHVLLDAWELPSSRDEATADEMATVLLVMFGESRRLDTAAEYFEGLSAQMPPISPGAPEMRHPDHARRARDLRRWQEQGDVLARRWQPRLVPHMRTALLRQLAAEPRAWTVTGLVREELARRDD